VSKRFLSFLVTTPLLVGLIQAPTAHAVMGLGPCNLSRGPAETTQHFSKRTIACAVNFFGPVPGGVDRAVCIASRESGLIPTAKSATGMYVGLFQHSAAAWPDRFATWTHPAWDLSPRPLNGRSNSIVTIRMVHAIGTWKAAGWPSKGC